MAEEVPKDWEKEYNNAFTKKIPFPILKYDTCKMNPVLPNLTYTLTTTGIRKDTKFELYVQDNTHTELATIMTELRASKEATDAKKKEEEKELKDAEEDKEDKEDKKEEEAPAPVVSNGYYGAPAPPPVVAVETYDVTEKALFQLAETKIKAQKEARAQEAENAKQKELDTKKATKDGTKKDDDDNESKVDEDEKKPEAEGINTDYHSFMKVETDKTYGENIKNCKKILTLWEITNRGYRKINESYIFESMNTTMEFSGDGKYMILSCTDSKTFMLYDAQNLTRINKMELTAKDANDYDVSYFYSVMLSKDGSYIISGDGYTRYIFDKNGKFIRHLPGRNMYTIFMYSETEFVGIQPTPDYTKSNLIAVDFVKDTEKTIYEFDQYVSNFTLSQDKTHIVYDFWPKVYYLNLKDKKKVELLKEYSSVYKYAFKGNKIAVCYSPNYSVTNVALFEGDKILWKHQLKKSYLDIQGFRFASDDSDIDSVIMIENQYTSFQIYRYDETSATDFTLKTIRNVNFQYPQIAYAVGTKEIWCQGLDNNIRIYYFDSNIAGMENDGNIKNDGSVMALGLVLDNQNYYQIAEAQLSEASPYITIYSRRIMKDEIPDRKVKAFYRIRMHNQEKKKIEEAIMLHLKDNLISLSLESRNIKHEFKKKANKTNIIALKDKSAIFVWEDNGSKIEKLKLPLDPSNSKAFQKVYEANEDMRLCKSTFIEGEEYIYIVDEAKHMKILKNEENRLSIYKDYFVDPYFSTYSDVQSLKQYSYGNEMVYSNSGGYLLQEKGKEKEFKFTSLYYSGYSFDYNNTKFPMCSDDFVLFALTPEYPPNGYTMQYQSLLLAPPMNSHRIKQRIIDESYSHEFFVHFDDKYILYYDGNYNYDQKLKILHLNGEPIQTVTFDRQTSMKKPSFSQSGEYMVLPMMVAEVDQKSKWVRKEGAADYTPDLPSFRLFKITKGKDYKKGGVEEGAIEPAVVEVKDDEEDDEEKKTEIVQLEEVDQFDFPHEHLMTDEYAYHAEVISPIDQLDDDKHILHVDNVGNVLYIFPIRKVFLINNQNVWDQFETYLKKGKLESWDEIEIFKFGQGYIIIKKEETIYHISYDGVKKKLVSGKEIRHKALDSKECDLEHIVPTKLSKYVLLFYQLGTSYTVVVWDLEKDYEHSNFSSREKDNFVDLITGKNSELGIVCFQEYIVDLDSGIPNPFMHKKHPAKEISWCQGQRINSAEDMLLSMGTIVTPLCHKDIYFYKNKSLDNLDYQKVVYYLDKHSVVFDYLDDHESLTKVLQVFQSQPLYYSMLILENKEGKTALDHAIENNAAKIIEIILNYLLELEHFSMSKKIYKKFSVLFNMNLKAFEKYLNTCYFETQQMSSITKAKLGDAQETIRESYTCCILDKNFYTKYQIAGHGVDEVEHSKVKSNAVAPIDRQNSMNMSSDQMNAQQESAGVFEEEENPLKRVQIKGIEFDWIFNSKEGDEFLKNLSETQNIEIFGQDIIRDIILFQWGYFKEMIILKLLIPYAIYFLIFCLYATWIMYERNEESDDGGAYHILGYVVGGIILAFNCFWAYVEITQMFFHRWEYLMSFWNILDASSVVLNVTVVIMVFLDVDYEDINRVSSVSVLILYFKLFYFLRIFFATAYLVRMIIEIVIDMKFFVSVLMIATIAFANSFYILGRNSDGPNLAGEDIAEAFIFSYKMGLGDFNTDGFETVDEEILWIIFLINTLIILIVLLNLVIAIMGDTFDRVQETQDKSLLRELAQMIRENEFLFSRGRAFKRAKYIIVIEPEKAEGEGSGSWEGKLNQLKTFIEDSSEAHITHLKKLQDGIENIAATALDEKMRPIEDKINHKLSQCDQRLEKIKTSVEGLFKLIDDQEA